MRNFIDTSERKTIKTAFFCLSEQFSLALARLVNRMLDRGEARFESLHRGR
jgi:hypothetical protein